MKANIVLLPGDGIGPEVIRAAQKVMDAVSSKFDHQFTYSEHDIGGCSIDAHGTALTDEALVACQKSDAIMLGAVGGPKWDDPTAKVRPEQGLLALRKGLGTFANLRPVKPHPDLLDASPLRPERLGGVDFVVVRELTGGIYFGEPRERRQLESGVQAVDTMSYTDAEIRRVAHLAFKLARARRSKVTSVDKANVLESSRLWRQTVSEVAKEYPDVKLEHILVDAAAMFLIQRPASFDVILTSNMFGDILTDEASVLTGSMGNLPSASLGDGGPGLYEPIHGSAPDIAGQGIANPIGTLLSMALMLRYSLQLEKESQAVERAVEKTLSSGHRTKDLANSGETALNTKDMTALIVERI
ncbi:MAG: 3-isopropylmalate dehydrogenase [Anaerolineales bacterium]|nr:3-isopropylmalate dehydrogenase [Chloroflexota bacterium]MBL6980469.1 3-isopropylmalate dehydrogenase [Anaerolineales bacterium]